MELTINNETIQIEDIFSDEIKRIIAKYSTQNALIKKIHFTENLTIYNINLKILFF